MARDAERPSEEAVQRLFELSLDMLGTSKDGYFTELNPAWERWLGWTREELMAAPFISFVHPDDVAATVERASSLAAPADDAVVTHENRYRTRSRGLPVAQLDDGGGRRGPLLRGEGRDRAQAARERGRRGRAADPRTPRRCTGR